MTSQIISNVTFIWGDTRKLSSGNDAFLTHSVLLISCATIGRKRLGNILNIDVIFDIIIHLYFSCLYNSKLFDFQNFKTHF